MALENQEINIKINVSNPAIKHLKKSYRNMKDEFDKAVFEYCLVRYKGNFLRVSNELGINRNTLRKRMRELDMYDEYI